MNPLTDSTPSTTVHTQPLPRSRHSCSPQPVRDSHWKPSPFISLKSPSPSLAGPRPSRNPPGMSRCKKPWVPEVPGLPRTGISRRPVILHLSYSEPSLSKSRFDLATPSILLVIQSNRECEMSDFTYGFWGTVDESLQ